MKTTHRGLHIGELARRAGITREAIRFYERRGLLPKVMRLTHNNYRVYPEATLHALGWIRTARELGFSLEEIHRVMPIFDAAGPRRPLSPHLRTAIESKLASLEETLSRMRSLKKKLHHLLDERVCDDVATVEAPHTVPSSNMRAF